MLRSTAKQAIKRSVRTGVRTASNHASPLQSLTASQAEAATLSYRSHAQRKQRQLWRSILVISLAGGIASISQHNSKDGLFFRQALAEAATEEEDDTLIFEESRKKPGLSKEENRDMISSQHHQVKRSWENPGVYAWGSNSGRVVAPDSDEVAVKAPRRIAYFDGKLLRDMSLDRHFGAAIDEKGNLIQWGTGFKPNFTNPEVTLKGKDLISLSLSKDRILGLSRSGKVYSIPVSAEEQENGIKPPETGWIPFLPSRSKISYRLIEPKGLGYFEKVSSIASGLEHALLLTSHGRLFSAASASDTFPNRGQLGVPGLTWATRPNGSYDRPHEILTLRGFNVSQIACGDFHSLALDKDGRIFAWGDNASGQLGFDYNPESSIIDAPSLIPTQKLYAGTSQVPMITKIAAGGSNSYMTIEATKVASQINDPKVNRGIGRITADTYAWGSGIQGNLANNRWTHVQSTPAKIPSLSSLFEYDEQNNTAVPIRLSHLAVGSTHAAAVMANITYLDASASTSTDDTNWGADIVFWGGNEHFQLGTGKRNNVSTPVYLQPLDKEAEIARAKKSSGSKEEHRFHITPRTTTRIGNGRKVSVEQRVHCGRMTTAVYSGT